jgi:hypothetical protein
MLRLIAVVFNTLIQLLAQLLLDVNGIANHQLLQLELLHQCALMEPLTNTGMLTLAHISAQHHQQLFSLSLSAIQEPSTKLPLNKIGNYVLQISHKLNVLQAQSVLLTTVLLLFQHRTSAQLPGAIQIPLPFLIVKLSNKIKLHAKLTIFADGTEVRSLLLMTTINQEQSFSQPTSATHQVLVNGMSKLHSVFMKRLRELVKEKDVFGPLDQCSFQKVISAMLMKYLLKLLHTALAFLTKTLLLAKHHVNGTANHQLEASHNNARRLE